MIMVSLALSFVHPDIFNDNPLFSISNWNQTIINLPATVLIMDKDDYFYFNMSLLYFFSNIDMNKNTSVGKSSRSFLNYYPYLILSFLRITIACVPLGTPLMTFCSCTRSSFILDGATSRFVIYLLVWLTFKPTSTKHLVIHFTVCGLGLFCNRIIS